MRPRSRHHHAKTRALACGAWLWLLGCLVVLPAAAHPVHTSFAEATYNAETRCLEITVRVFTDDLVAALTRHAGRVVSLEATPAAELDGLMLAYLNATFTVKSATGEPAPLSWVGWEFEPRPENAATAVPAHAAPAQANNDDSRILLHFEALLPSGVIGARLRHRVLCDLFEDQKNSIRVKDGPRRVTLGFYPDSGEKAVSFSR